MLRSSLPRVSRQASRLVMKGLTGPCGQTQPVRGFGSRWLVSRRRPTWWLDDFADSSWPHRMMENHMRSMQRMMDDMTKWAPRWVQPVFEEGQVRIWKEHGLYKVKVDLDGLKPEGITVKAAGDNLVITAVEEEGPAAVSRRITIRIPEEVESDTLESVLRQDGFLVINGRLKETAPIEEKVIEVKREAKKEDTKVDEKQNGE